LISGARILSKNNRFDPLWDDAAGSFEGAEDGMPRDDPQSIGGTAAFCRRVPRPEGTRRHDATEAG